MRIIIIRHGDPDYSIDGLTEKGKKEVEFLARRMEKEQINSVYCSVLGRARLTAQPFLDRKGLKAEYCEWLREYSYATILDPKTGKQRLCWDLMPDYINAESKIFHPTDWRGVELIKESKVPETYDIVCKEFDNVLLKHGYRRSGYNYLVEKSNHDTIVFVCHFGITGILLAHLMNCSPYSIWQHAFTAPTAVTTIYTEEREEGIAQFRATSIGDISHLNEFNEEPSFSGRFCECFTDDTRH